MARNDRVSRFTVVQQWSDGRLGLFHTVHGTTLEVPQRVVEAIAEGQIERLTPAWRTPLRKQGFLLPDERDEQQEYDQARQANDQQQAVEVTFLATSPEAKGGLNRNGVRAVAKYLDEIADAGNPRTVKLRFCGHGNHPLRERIEAFRSLVDHERPGLTMIGMWLSDTIRDADEQLQGLAPALYFQWDVRGPDTLRALVMRAFAEVKRLADRGHLVYIQVAAEEEQDVVATAEQLHLAAGICAAHSGGHIRWGTCLLPASENLPYFAPNVCRPEKLEQVRLLRRIVARLRMVGVPADFPIGLRHHNGGCPYAHPQSAVFDRKGNQTRCLQSEVKNAARGSKASGEAACQACALLPVCESRCPRLRRGGKQCDVVREVLQVQTDPGWKVQG